MYVCAGNTILVNVIPMIKNFLFSDRVERILALLLIAGLMVSWLCNIDNTSTKALLSVAYCTLVALLSGLLYIWNGRIAMRLMALLIAAYVCYESLLGLLQNYGMIRSNNEVYQITGSFMNPNPYGCFLSIALSILIPFLLLNKDEPKMVRILMMLSVGLALTVIPSTRCRAAYCSLFAALMPLALTNVKCRRFVRSYIVILLAVVILLLAAMYLWKRPSADWRMFQNRVSLMAIRDTGFMGAGLGHYASSAQTLQTAYFKASLSLDDGYVHIPDAVSRECRMAGRSLFAFCDPLHIGVEAGILVMVLYILLVVVAAVRLLRARSPLFYGMVALQVSSLFTYSLLIWQIHILLAIMIAAAGVCRKSELDRGIVVGGACLATLMIIVLAFAWPRQRAVNRVRSEWLSNQCFYNGRDYKLYAQYCEPMLTTQCCNEEYMLQYGTSLAKIGELMRSDSILLMGVRLTGNPAFLIQLGDNSLLRGECTAAQEYYWDAFCSLPDRLLPLYRLALTYKVHADAESLERLQEYVLGYHPRIESSMTDKLREGILSMSAGLDEDVESYTFKRRYLFW